MDWSVKPVDHLQPFLNGDWPMAHKGIDPVHSQMLFSPEESSRLFFKAIASYPRRSKHTIFTANGTGAQYEPGVRDTDDLGPGNPFVEDQLVERFTEAGERGVYELTGRKVKLRSTVPLQILGYERDSKFIQHADSHIYTSKWVHNTPERKYSSICWLSSYALEPTRPHEFNGGRISFPYFDTGNGKPLEILPRAGQFVIFPSHPVYSHEVTPVKRGYRVALVNFWDVTT